MKNLLALSLTCSLVAACAATADDPRPEPQGVPEPSTSQEPPYRSSVVGTDFDFITADDPDTFESLTFRGVGRPEMPDKRGGSSLLQPAFQFVARFTDGARIHIAIDADFETVEAARAQALRITPRIGKLPSALRGGLERVVVHQGGEDTTAFSDRGLAVLYSDNVTKRIGTHDLEETVFHESVHAVWDPAHANSEGWRAAQAADGAFVTAYGAKKPGLEDLAESALFAFTLLHHPERIPAEDAALIRARIPARIAYVAKLLPPGEPLHHPVDVDPYLVERLLSSSGVEAILENPDPRICTVNLALPGQMADIVSNALVRELDRPGSEVRTFLSTTQGRCTHGDELLARSAEHFEVEEAVLRAAVERFRHTNCTHD